MKRGDIYLANLAPRSGSEQQGRRPVIIISHNALNEGSSALLVQGSCK
ncbi:MAG: type II toxin-antitoxin system PemK/MazF family toxin [Pyrinomonadaceae bacterium]